MTHLTPTIDITSQNADERSYLAWKLGYAYYRKSEYRKAIDYLLQSLSVTLDHAPTSYLISASYYHLDDLAEAMTYARMTLQFDPNHCGAYLVLLRSLRSLAKWEEILSISDVIPKSLSQSNEYHLISAEANANLLQSDQAKAHLETLSKNFRARNLPSITSIEGMLQASHPPES